MTVTDPPTTRTLRGACPLDCPDTCSLDLAVEDGRLVGVDGSRTHPFTDGYICSKVRAYADHVYHPDRLRQPLLRTGAKGAGEYRPASWDEALERIAAELVSARDSLGGQSILPFSYGGSNGSLTEGTTDARLFRRLGASRLLKTVCAVPTTLANLGLYGCMPGTALDDYEHAALICVWGANPHASGVHAVPPIRRAQERGARLVVVDPRRTKLARVADLHLAPRPGTDVVLALAVHRWLFEQGAADLEFLARHTTGGEELRRRAEPWTLARAAATCDVAAADIERFARTYAEASPAVVRCGWGLERNRNGGSAAAAVLALPAVAGKFGVRGGGFTMSNSRAWSLADPIEDAEPETRAINMNRLGRVLLAPTESLAPPIRVLFVYDANPLATLPEQNLVRAGLERDDLFTVVFDQVLTDTARFADVVLPATTFVEHHELRKGYGAFALLYAEPAIEPVGESRPNYAVFGELVRRTGLARPGDTDDPAELARRVVDDEARWHALQADGIAYPPTGTHPVAFVDVFPRTADRKVHLVPADLDDEAPAGLYGYRADPATDAYPLALISPATTKRVSSSLGELHRAEEPLGLHPADAAPRGITTGDRVRVHNELGEVLTVARVTDELRPGTVCLAKGLWSFNTANGSTSNALVPASLTDVGGGACFNDARVQVERLGPG